jgi:hypothetical protein
MSVLLFCLPVASSMARPPAVKPETTRLTLNPPFNCQAPANFLVVFRLKQAAGVAK